MRVPHLLAFTAILGVGACASPPMDESLISRVPASPERIAAARETFDACSKALPDVETVKTGLRKTGFPDGPDASILTEKTPDMDYWEAKGADMFVTLASLGPGGFCLVGLAGMTPEQAVKLAQFVAVRTGAIDGSAIDFVPDPEVAGIWGKLSSEGVVMIVAFKGLEELGAPGGGVLYFIAPAETTSPQSVMSAL